jgi:PRC-barrel domain
MNKLIIASAAAALMMGVSASAFAQATQQDCQSMFQKADVNKDSSLQAEEAKVFLDAMNQAQVQPKDASMVTQDEFMQACQKNAFANIDPNTIGTAAATGTTTTGQGTTTTDQSAAGTTTTETTTTDTATTDQPESGTTATTTTTTDPAATGTATTDQTASTDTTGQAQQQSGEQALAAPSGLLASNIIGSTVYSQDNQSIGDINDIILSQEGQPSQVIVGVGGFLGIGEKDVVLEMSKLQIAATEDGSVKIVAQTSPEELRNMPPFMRQGAGEQQPEQQQQQQQ